jgi:hypothetical protein
MAQNKKKNSRKRIVSLKNISGSIQFNKKMFGIFLLLFAVIGGIVVLSSRAATDPKLATTFAANSPYFQHPATNSEFKTDGGTAQVLANSVNTPYPQLLWVGPGASFTYHKDNVNPGYIQACFRVRDSGAALFGAGASANLTFAITTDGGTKNLATATTTLDYGYHNTTVYGYYPYCIQTSPLTDGRTYNNIQYRVTVNKGAVFIQSLDIHGVDFAYTPSASSPTTPSTPSKKTNTTNNQNDQVTCQAIGCPTSGYQGSFNENGPVLSSSPKANTVVNFNNSPPPLSATEAAALSNYLGAIECSKQPLMEWKDNKCVAMDFSFVPVLLNQVGNYINSLQQQANYAPRSDGGGYVQQDPPADPLAGLGFLNDIMCGVVPCGAYASTPEPSVSYCHTLGLPYNYTTKQCGV